MKYKKRITFFMLLIFMLHFYFLPALKAITVEEEAGRKGIEKKETVRERSESAGEDDFFGKVIENRNYAGRPRKKDPRLACLLSLVVPGGGHIYLRKDLKGIVFCLATGTGYSVSGYYLYRSFIQNKGPDFRSKVIVSGLLVLISGIVHVVGIVEAYTDAEEINKKSFYGSNDTKTPYVTKLIIE